MEIAKHSIKFLDYWGISVPTTCCHQILLDDDVEDLDVEVIQFFCSSGLGICYQIKDFWSHCFMAASFYHCTSAALYKIDGKFFMGEYPGINVFAWGKGGTANNRNRNRGNGATNVGAGGGNDQPGNGGQPLDDVAKERDGQANGRDQCLDVALHLDRGLTGPDGDSNKNNNNNADNGSDGNDGHGCNTGVDDDTNDSEDRNRWGSGGEHGNEYGPGNGDGLELSDDDSEENAAPSAHGMHVDEALHILGIANRRDISKQDLNRIHRRRMLEVHPDRVQRTGLSQQQAVLMSQRLNDAVEEMRIHLNLPHGQNRFDPFVVDNDSDEEED